MSSVDAYAGKLIPVDMKGRTIEEVSQELCDAEELPSYFNSWLEQLQEEQWGNYYYNAELSQLFRVEKEEFDPENLSIVKKNDDGTYEFIVSYYNGGTYLDEVLADGIRKTGNS